MISGRPHIFRAMPHPRQLLYHSLFTPEALENSPITPDTSYIIHLATWHDFGPVISHRYFACPATLEHHWQEATLVQWFANGEQFKLQAHKWNLKCPVDSLFYRMILRPNLALRSISTTTSCTGMSDLDRGSTQTDLQEIGVRQFPIGAEL